MKRILVTGSRDWPDTQGGWETLYRAIRFEVDEYSGQHVLVHGNARGADRTAQRAAHWIGIEDEPHPADWDQYGKRAGFIRNKEMVDAGADVCLAFALKWDSGTGHCARLARKAGIRTIDYGVDTSIEAKP